MVDFYPELPALSTQSIDEDTNHGSELQDAIIESTGFGQQFGLGCSSGMRDGIQYHSVACDFHFF